MMENREAKVLPKFFLYFDVKVCSKNDPVLAGAVTRKDNFGFGVINSFSWMVSKAIQNVSDG